MRAGTGDGARRYVPAPRSLDAGMLAPFAEHPNPVGRRAKARISVVVRGFVVAAGHLVHGVEEQQNADNEEAEAAPILEVPMPAGRDDQRRERETAQQKEDGELRDLHGTGSGSCKSAAK